MKVALVILHADPNRGGAERYTLDLACSLRDLGDDVHLLAGSFKQLPEGVACLKLPFHGATRVGRYSMLIEGLRRHLTTHRYDIVHAMMPVYWCNVYHPHAGLALEAVKSPHAVRATRVGQMLSSFANRFNRRRQKMAQVEQELLTTSYAPVVLCLSQYVRNAVRRWYPLPDERLPILFNAVNLQKFDPEIVDGSRVREQLRVDEDDVLALMTAQDLVRKGLSQTLEAMKRIIDQPLKLVVVSKQDTSGYEEQAKQLGIADRVIFAGPTLTPERFVAACDMLVLPTRHDPCSLSTLEALAMGKPVISTRSNGATEIMRGGREGFILADPDDVDALAAAMRRLCDNEARQMMSAAALSLRPKLAWEQHVQALREIYTRIATPAGLDV